MTVSTVIPTYNRADLLLDRALPSVLAQTHHDIEVIVVGDGTDDETVERMAALDDPRVRFVNLPRQRYPDDYAEFWRIAGMEAINHGLDMATGEWVCILADDDALEPHHHEVLLAASGGVDLVWGQSATYVDGRRMPRGIYGDYPQLTTRDICVGAFILRARLNHRVRHNVEGWSWDEEWWTNLLLRNVTWRKVKRVVHQYHPNPEAWHLHGFHPGFVL